MVSTTVQVGGAKRGKRDNLVRSVQIELSQREMMSKKIGLRVYIQKLWQVPVTQATDFGAGNNLSI